MMQLRLYLLWLFIFLTVQDEYYVRTSFYNEGNYTHIAYTPDQTSLFLFRPGYNVTSRYRGYNYQYVEDITLDAMPTFITAWTNTTNGQSSIIYTTYSETYENDIRGRKVNSGQDKVVSNPCLFGVQKSSNKTFLYISPNSSVILTVSLQFNTVSRSTFESFNCEGSWFDLIYAVKWLNNDQFIISYITFQKFYLQIRSQIGRAQKDLTYIAQRIVLDFAVKDNVIYFIEEASEEDIFNEEYIIKVYGLQAEKNRTITVPASSPLKGINIRGQFMEVIERDSRVWIYHLFYEEWFGSYMSVLQGYGLSPDGSEFIAIMPDDQEQIRVYRYCPTNQTYYEEDDYGCNYCDSNCSSCQFKTERCYQCIDGYYVANSKCLACMDGCLKCTAATVCQTCIQSWQMVNSTCVCPLPEYVVSNTACLLCTQTILGCAACYNSTACFICQDGYSIDQQRHCKRNDPVDDNKTIIIVASVGGAVVVAGAIGIAWYLKRKRRPTGQRLLESDDVNS